MNNIIIFYDISNTKYRNKLKKILESYGVGIQKSVFECFLDNKRYKDLLKHLENTKIDFECDSIIIIELKNGVKKQIGNQYSEKIFMDVIM